MDSGIIVHLQVTSVQLSVSPEGILAVKFEVLIAALCRPEGRFNRW